MPNKYGLFASPQNLGRRGLLDTASVMRYGDSLSTDVEIYNDTLENSTSAGSG